MLLGYIGSEIFLIFSSPMIFCKSTEVIRTGDAPALVSHEQKLSKAAEPLPCSDPRGSVWEQAAVSGGGILAVWEV